MNKLGYQPLPILLRAEPDEARRTSKATKILGAVATLGALCAVCGAVAVCSIGFNSFPRRTLEGKVPAELPAFSETPVSPSAATNHIDGTATLPPDSTQALPGMIAEDHSIVDQTTKPGLDPNSAPAATPQPEASANNHELLNGAGRAIGQTIPGSRLPETVRKKLEKMRRAAEDRRSRLEEQFGKNAISSEAYKKGEEKYQREIEKYRREMSARTAQANSVSGEN
jgi:hypothetical protein